MPDLTFVILSKSASGGETIAFTGSISIPNTDANNISGTDDLAALVDRKVGTYVVRLVRANDVLAEGNVELTK